MPFTTLSSREFNRSASRALRAADNGPVFITDRGRPAHVLVSIQDYQQFMGSATSTIDMLAVPRAGAVEFNPPRARKLYRPADLS
jgi:prevent-host-death family protein